jgi:hypothetical protein
MVHLIYLYFIANILIDRLTLITEQTKSAKWVVLTYVSGVPMLLCGAAMEWWSGVVIDYNAWRRSQQKATA